MIVPDLAGLSDATELKEHFDTRSNAAEHNGTEELNVTETLNKTGELEQTEPIDLDNITEIVKEAVRKALAFGDATATLQASTGPPLPKTVETTSKPKVLERQTCAVGSSYYACANGFIGCCTVNPCDADSDGCPDSQYASSLFATSTTSEATVTGATTETPLEATATGGTSKSSGSIRSTMTSTKVTSTSNNSPSLTLAASTAPITKAKPAPACPGANNAMYTDSAKIEYRIFCAEDNSYESLSQVQVTTGGYSECFSSCSVNSDCAGFTYVGLDSGDCYLKQQLPVGQFVQKAGDNYISCAKTNSTAASPLPSSAPSGHKSNVGAIAGGIVGGVAVLALLLVLIAFVARHRRRRIEERRASATNTYSGGPLEATEPLYTSPTRSHGRSGSTARDAFAPFGGFYRGHSSAQADQLSADEKTKMEAENAFVPNRPPPSLPPAARLQHGVASSVYSRPDNPSEDKVTMLDSTPIARPISATFGTRAPRFREHIAEMEDTSIRAPPNRMGSNSQKSPSTPNTDSPTLGRVSGGSSNRFATPLAAAVTKRQHLLSWNTYDPQDLESEMDTTGERKTPPSASSDKRVSPYTSDAPRDPNFVVSPFSSIDRGRQDQDQRYGSL